MRLPCFNPRARVGRDRAHRSREAPVVLVSIHAPAWGATTHPRRHPHGARVSIHAPAWGATAWMRMHVVLVMFQSTRPRGARPARRAVPVEHAHVSIHAPAWGATQDAQVRRLHPVVSIHAPAWGATQVAGEPHLRRRVSIHAPAWGATDTVREVGFIFIVSIHAPAWGATRSDVRRRVFNHCFNPRARVGRDTLPSSMSLSR